MSKKPEIVEGEAVEKPALSNKKIIKKKLGYGAFAAVVVTIFAYIFSQFLAAIFLGFWVRATGGDIETSLSNMSSSTELQFAFFVIVEAITLYIIWWFLKSRGNSWKDIGLARKPRKQDILPALAVFGVYFVFLIIVTTIISGITGINTEQEQQIGFDNAKTAIQLGMVFISLVILPPLVEEIVVRGFLYTGLKKKFKQNIAAVLTSLLFGIAHLQLGSGEPPLWIAAIDTVILSMFLIYLREKTGALWSGMLVHAIKNGLAFVFLFVVHIPGI
jgi:uncharacterized protein